MAQVSEINSALTEDITAGNKFNFKFFPAYAGFVRDNYLVPYIQEQIRISKEIQLPMLRFFEGMTDADLISMAIESHKEFLTNAEDNKLKQHLEKGLALWVADGLGIMKRDEVTAEDITLSGYMRKKALLKFLPNYTTDVSEAVEIIKEIDSLTVEGDTAATNIYINLLKERISDAALFSERLSHTTPGLNYVFDLSEKRIKYANKNAEHFFGLPVKQLQDMAGSSSIEQLVHPDDVATFTTSLVACAHAADQEVISSEFRLKGAHGAYTCMRNYASVFKRNSKGAVTEIVGIILDVTREKEIEDRLVYREQQLLDAQAQALLGSFELDVATGEMDVSEQFKKIYELNEFDLYKLIDHVHPADRANTNAKRDKAIAENGIYESEYRYLINGKEKILWSKGTVGFRDGRKKLIGTVMDVTGKTKMLRELLESRELYKQAQELAHIGNWAYDIAADKWTWSDEIYTIYELEPQSLKTSATLDKYNHPDDTAIIRDTMRRAIEDRQPFDFNYRIILKSGRTKILHAKGGAEHDPNGGFKIYGTLQDITEQKNIERQLKDYKEFIEKITDVTPSIITSYNINTGEYSFINDAIEKFLGYSPSRVMEEGTAFMSSIIHPDDKQALMEKNAKALEEANQMTGDFEEPVVEFKFRMRNAEGIYRWFHTYATIFERNDLGLVESVLNISIDITDQEEAEKELYSKNIQLQQSNTSLEEYAYVASHDLKEPLRKIVTFSDRMLVTQKDTLNEDGKLYLNKIITAALRMQNMINDLLAVSTIMGNNSFEPTDLNMVLEEATIALDHKIEETGAVIEADRLPVLAIAPSQFRQLFQNLINNSLKFARNGVPSHIRITNDILSYQAVQQYGLAKAKKYLRITIADNGIGFDDQYAAKIFAIFQRLHGRSEYEGTGIGLSVCKKVAENHGGTIFAHGVENEGATFTLIIPIME